MTRVTLPAFTVALLLAGGTPVHRGIGQDRPVAPAGAIPGAVPGDPHQAPGVPMVITSDTRAYCLNLADQVDHSGSLPPDIHALRDEGRALCADGHVRRGINRLRHALMALRAEHEDPRHRSRDYGEIQPNE
ncbi:hypothetical protein [Rhizosaccharibacter radicis]|uniref:UrcA family protein n=1 Tax=Rhizosaccharibacter radicis TaxID=2782605 RepID=A0ABT1W187_9PROT|nr:hypothetical protein [Acetobacteraceae bacterium KSS12]